MGHGQNTIMMGNISVSADSNFAINIQRINHCITIGIILLSNGILAMSWVPPVHVHLPYAAMSLCCCLLPVFITICTLISKRKRHKIISISLCICVFVISWTELIFGEDIALFYGLAGVSYVPELGFYVSTAIVLISTPICLIASFVTS